MWKRLLWVVRNIPVWECKICGHEAVIAVDVRHVCMNCGEEQ